MEYFRELHCREEALNLSEPWEFGYALGVSRPLALAASSKRCVFCRENFAAGVELYGGLGDLDEFGLKDTSHYLAPSSGFQYSPRADGQLLTQLRAQRQQPGSDLPHQGRLRTSTNFGLVPPGRAMKGRGGTVAGMILGAVLFSGAVDNSWIEKVPEADRNRKNPFAGQADAVLPGRTVCRSLREVSWADALGRGKRPSLRSKVVQQAADGQIFWFLRNGNLRRGMPSWSSLPEPSRWQIITYLKSLREQTGPGAKP